MNHGRNNQMKLPNWVRHLPHPEYGNYGGRRRRCLSHENADKNGGNCPLPVDRMDKAFQTHDTELRHARLKYKPGPLRESALRLADEKLALTLKSLPRFTGYKHKIWGPIYRFLASIPFRN